MISIKSIKLLFNRFRNVVDSNTLEILSESRNMLLNQPPCFISARASIQNDCFQFCKKLNTLLSEKRNHLIFVIGEWGSGKTTHIRHFETTHCNDYNFAEKSFFSIHTLHEGFLNLLNIYSKFFSVIGIILFVTLFYFKIGLLISIPVVAIFVAHIFITNIWKFYYIVVSAFESFILKLKNKSQVCVIEDLDRSSMQHNDQWALLSSLRHVNFKYIISYGFSSEDEKIDIIQIAQKLEAKTIELPLDHKVNFKIVQEREIDFPFSESRWMEIFTPRELLHIIDDVRRISKGHKILYMQAYFVYFFYKEMLKKLKVDRDHFHYIRFRFETPYVRLSDGMSSQRLSPTISSYFRSMGDSIKHDFVKSYQNLFLPKTQPASSNWFDIELNKLLSLPHEQQVLAKLDT